MDELLEQFLIEGRDLVAQVTADLDSLGRDRGNAAAIDSAFRAIHTLKGSVSLFPMRPAGDVLHAAEDVLDRARRDGGVIDDDIIRGLLACVDAVDRWIDDIAETGALPEGAERRAAAAIAGLAGANAPHAPSSGREAPEWIATLIRRESAVIDTAEAPLTAFRFEPDAECFFRGVDPLAVVSEIPDLLALAILPVAGAWPSIDAIEPFECISTLEGISAAPLGAVRAAFRLMSDQVELHLVQSVDRAETGSGSANVPTVTALRVDAARIDALADGLGELVVAINGFAPIATRAAALDPTLAVGIRTVQKHVEHVAADLHRNISAVRQVPLGGSLRRLPRLVRDIAGELGKQVDFTMAGEAIEVDRQIADGLFEPLLHLIRNAVDHGIEAPDLRRHAGKPASGRVSLQARRDGDAILLALADDGAGIDPERIRAIAVSRAVLDADTAAQLSETAALRLIFRPGFSTAEAITGVSGRGVGMDVVLTAVERLRGTIDVASEPGLGTRFQLRFPTNMLTTPLLVVAVGEDRYGVALDQIEETVRIDTGALRPIGGGSACVLRGRTVPVLSLATLLGATDRYDETVTLLVTRVSGDRVALKVDGFAERIDALVRPPGGILAHVPGVTGSTLLGDGGVLLVLDLSALAA